MKSKMITMTAIALTSNSFWCGVRSGQALASDGAGHGRGGQRNDKNAGALTAPEANKSDAPPPSANTGSGDAAANIPGTKSEGNSSEANPTLSGDNSAPSMQEGGDSGNAAANVPGTKSDGNSSETDPSLSGDGSKQ